MERVGGSKLEIVLPPVSFAYERCTDMPQPESKEVIHPQLLTVETLDVSSDVGSKLLETQDLIEQADAYFEHSKLDLYEKILTRTYEEGCDATILRKEMRAGERQLLTAHEQTQRELFEQQKAELKDLTSTYNALREAGGHERELLAIRRTITALERRIEIQEASLSTHTLTLSRLRLFSAIVEKRLSLIEERQRLQRHIHRHPLDLLARFRKYRIESSLGGRVSALAVKRGELTLLFRRIRNDPSLSLGSRERSLNDLSAEIRELDAKLAQAPSLDYLRQVASEIERGLHKPNRMLDFDRADQTYKDAIRQLDWGSSHLKHALTSPANWPTTHRTSVLTSRSGNLYAFATEVSPIRGEDGSVIPSCLRSKKAYNHRPVNFQQTTHYMLGSEETSRTVSFRGAQFATKEAAKEVIWTMLAAGSVTDLHFNALLTPSRLPGVEDKSLLEQHRKNLQDAIAEVGEEVDRILTNPNGMDEVDFGEHLISLGYLPGSLQRAWSLSNFGVNAGAHGEYHKLPAFGWHTATAVYNNTAMIHLNERMYKTLTELRAKVAVGAPLNERESHLLQNLSPIASTGQELKRMWEQNEFAAAAKGQDQFKMPATLKVIDLLIGTTCYTNCKSGKDRTGETEAAAAWEWEELQMEALEKRAALRKHLESVERVFTAEEVELLTNPFFEAAEIDTIIAGLNVGERLDDLLQRAHLRKLDQVFVALGYNKGAWLAPKRVRFAALPGTTGIEKTSSAELEKTAAPAERDRRLRNRDRSFKSASAVTRQNAAYTGVKVEGTAPVRRSSSGFDRQYVIEATLKDGFFDAEEFLRLTGVRRLGSKTANRLERTAHDISRQPEAQRITSLLKQVEVEKRKLRSPVISTSA